MKKITILFILLVSTVIFSSPSYAGWTRVSSSGGGANTFYVDFDRIRKVDGYVYYWELGDLFKPMGNTDILSVKTYNQVDCKKFRINRLTFSSYKEPLGKGSDETFNPETEWLYPPPDSSLETFLKFACEFVK